MSTLADRLTEIMVARNIKTKAALARLAGVTDAGVHWMFNSAETLSLDTAMELQKKTKYRAEWIAYGRGAKKVDMTDDEDMLSPDEKDLLQWYRDLTPAQKLKQADDTRKMAEHNREVAEMLLQRQQAEKDKP